MFSHENVKNCESIDEYTHTQQLFNANSIKLAIWQIRRKAYINILNGSAVDEIWYEEWTVFSDSVDFKTSWELALNLQTRNKGKRSTLLLYEKSVKGLNETKNRKIRCVDLSDIDDVSNVDVVYWKECVATDAKRFYFSIKMAVFRCTTTIAVVDSFSL